MKERRRGYLLGKPLPDEYRGRLAALVAAEGETAAIARLGIPRTTIARAIAGLGLREGTRHLIAARLGMEQNTIR